MNGFLLCAGLLAVGALPVLAVLLGQWSRSERPRVRAAAKLLSFVLLFAVFVITAGGLLASFIYLFGHGDIVVIASGAAVYLLVAGWLSHYVVYGKSASAPSA